MSPKLDRKQVEVTEPTRMLTHVSKPILTIYRPAKEKDAGTAMQICPGGFHIYARAAHDFADALPASRTFPAPPA
jgi:hypothetical protein